MILDLLQTNWEDEEEEEVEPFVGDLDAEGVRLGLQTIGVLGKYKGLILLPGSTCTLMGLLLLRNVSWCARG